MKDISVFVHKHLLFLLVGILLITGAGIALSVLTAAPASTEHVAIPTSHNPEILSAAGDNASASLQHAADSGLQQSNMATYPEWPVLVDELLLVGMVLSSDTASSNAVIEYRGKQRIYAVGDAVIHPDLALRNVSEKQAVIEFQKQQLILALSNGLLVSQPLPKPADDIKPEYAGDDNYLNHAQLIKLTPRYKQNVLQGLSAAPKGDSRKFIDLGLMSDDIITEINGVSMTTMEGIEQSDALLHGTEPLQLSVQRQGRLMTLFIEPQYAHNVL